MKILSLLARAGVLLPVCAAFFLGGCGKSSNEAAVIVVGTEPEFPPFEFKTETGELAGFDIDLVKAVAAKAGFTVKFQEMGFDGLIPALQSGQISMIASGLSITEERRKNITFSAPYIEAGLSIAVREGDDAIKGSTDLTGKTVAVQQGSTGAEAAGKLAAEGKIKELRQFANVSLCMMELAKGGVDAVINDRPTSVVYIARQPGKIKLLPETLVSDAYGFGFNKKSTDLVAKVDAALAALKADGTFGALEAKYFSKE